MCNRSKTTRPGMAVATPASSTPGTCLGSLCSKHSPALLSTRHSEAGGEVLTRVFQGEPRVNPRVLMMAACAGSLPAPPLSSGLRSKSDSELVVLIFTQLWFQETQTGLPAASQMV